MEIPNLSQPNPNINLQNTNKSSLPILIIIIVIAITGGFWLSRLMPINKNTSIISTLTEGKAVSTDNIANKDEIQVGKLYGNQGKNFKDTASGTIEKGSLNGEGTHVLNREGGASQRAALTSSVVDLDLFVGKKVEIKGETQASTKVGWFMDVGNIKVLE